MPSALPVGDPVPADGRLPPSASAGLGQRPFGIYVHVPFCRVRCGYCDFNTYTVPELGGHGATVDTYADAALAEVRLARQVLGGADGVEAVVPEVATVFVGGAPRPCSRRRTWSGCLTASASSLALPLARR